MSEVARRLNTTITSVFRWSQAHRRGGKKALASRPVPGRPRKLSEMECKQLLNLLLKGAVVYGFTKELWTLKRIARVIHKEFGVSYHPNHVWRILRRCGWSCQVPERRALQRDEKAIEHWKRHTWPVQKKTPKTWGPPHLP
ncbi:MAG: transposase [Planctomycetes bacterium]|nr:transposase [Planctomycetota bacterium]